VTTLPLLLLVVVVLLLWKAALDTSSAPPAQCGCSRCALFPEPAPAAAGIADAGKEAGGAV
jgi:hypothetical protein